MRSTLTQSNLTAGELSPDMAARVDHDIYYRGVSKAQNVVVMPHGGLRRRPGLTRAQDSLVGNGKLFSFEFSLSQDYLIHVTAGLTSIYKDGVFQVSVVNFYDADEVDEVDAAQAGDVMIFTHDERYPMMLRREGSDVDWSLAAAPLSNIPVFDFGTGDEPVWSATRGYPAVCTFFQSRLWFAGSTQRPASVWGSKVNSFYDFDIGTGQADFGIFDTIDTDQFNQITNIFPGRNLMVFTGNAEFYNTADFITSETSTWKRSTGFGSKRIRPLLVDGAVLFVDRIGRTVRSTVFEFTEDAYVSPSISLVADHLITDVISMDAVKGTNIDVSDFVYIVNADGTLAVLNTIRSEKIQGWTQWTTQGYFRDVIVVNKIVYFLIERQGEFHLEYMNEGTTLDHNTVAVGISPEVFNVAHNTNNVIDGSNNVVFSEPGAGTTVTEIDTGETAAIAAMTHKVLLDNSVMADSLGGVITLERPAYKAEVGLDVELIVRTMPLNGQVQDGISLNMRKRVIKVLLNMRDSLGVFAFDTISPDRQFTVVLDQAPEPFTGLKEIYLLGYNRVTTIEITQNDPLPFKLLGLGHETEV